ncbi:hypothetical protein BOX15_Mlig032934g2, partial [Macrostomum lignano]
SHIHSVPKVAFSYSYADLFATKTMTTHKLICLFMVAFALLEAAPAHGLGIRRSPNDHYADEYSKNFEVEFERPGSHSVLKRYCGFLDLGGHCDAMHGAELLDQILHLSRPGGPGKRRKRTAERRPLPGIILAMDD